MQGERDSGEGRDPSPCYPHEIHRLPPRQVTVGAALHLGGLSIAAGAEGDAGIWRARMGRKRNERPTAFEVDHPLASSPSGKLWLAVLESTLRDLNDSALELERRVDVPARKIRNLVSATKRGLRLERDARALEAAQECMRRIEDCIRFFFEPEARSSFLFITTLLDVSEEYIRDRVRRVLRERAYDERREIVKRCA